LAIEEPTTKKDFEKIHKYVNQSFKGKTIKDIQELSSSMSIRGFNEIYDKDETLEGEMVGTATPETAMVKNAFLNGLVSAWKDLTLFEQKLLLLKFGQLDFLH
jgi:transcriptional regulator of heat shock response